MTSDPTKPLCPTCQSELVQDLCRNILVCPICLDTPPAETGRCIGCGSSDNQHIPDAGKLACPTQSMDMEEPIRYFEPAAPVSPPEDIEYHSKVANATLGRIYAKEYKKVGEVAPVSPEPPPYTTACECGAIYGRHYGVKCPYREGTFVVRDTGPVGAKPEPEVTPDHIKQARSWRESIEIGREKESLTYILVLKALEALGTQGIDFLLAAYAAAQSLSSPTQPQWKCVARNSNMGAGDPPECDWPVCGCDPYADKVIAALQESGVLGDLYAAGSPVQPVGQGEEVDGSLSNVPGGYGKRQYRRERKKA